jgi:hypothetical protein
MVSADIGQPSAGELIEGIPAAHVDVVSVIDHSRVDRREPDVQEHCREQRRQPRRRHRRITQQRLRSRFVTIGSRHQASSLIDQTNHSKATARRIRNCRRKVKTGRSRTGK